jgi:hypothetical protein
VQRLLQAVGALERQGVVLRGPGDRYAVVRPGLPLARHRS